MDTVVISSLTAAVTLLSQEFSKGLASEAGKAAWLKVKDLFGWQNDPPLAEVPSLLAKDIEARPEIAGILVEILKQQKADAASSLVSNLHVEAGGRVVLAHFIGKLEM